jgi:hypothetical protein
MGSPRFQTMNAEVKNNVLAQLKAHREKKKRLGLMAQMNAKRMAAVT